MSVFLSRFKIFYIVEPIWQRLSLENLHLNPFPEALVSDYLDLAISMDNPAASHQKCTKAKMESYLGTCYAQNNTTTMCDVPFRTASNNLIYCQPGALTDVTHSVKANICAADTKYGNYIDKERYKTMRKWKQIGRDYAKVELYQSGIELLSRDNVGIIAKLSLRDSPETQVVVATTHLLYNPRRNDVRLAQTQLLLAEIERIAFIENTITGPKYLPIILTGDFNLEPFTGVYKFLTEGSFEYYGKGRNLQPSQYNSLSNSLIPSRLCITDNCQHFNILTQRLRREGTGRVMLENSELPVQKQDENMPTPCNVNVLQQNNVNITTGRTQIIEIIRGYSVRFSSGTLTHPFNMRSVYRHTSTHGEKEATTHQDEWITVDYIFYSNIQPIEKYALPT
ncbi:protein angel-like protein 2 protein, partial [Lasius niger]